MNGGDDDGGILSTSLSELLARSSVDTLTGSSVFRNSVIAIVVSWIVTNVFLDPARVALDLLDGAIALVTGTLDSSIRASLRPAGSVVWDAFLGPDGIVPSIREPMVELSTSTGLAAPVAAGAVNLVLIVVVVGGVYLLVRVVAGYVSGGVLS